MSLSRKMLANHLFHVQSDHVAADGVLQPGNFLIPTHLSSAGCNGKYFCCKVQADAFSPSSPSSSLVVEQAVAVLHVVGDSLPELPPQLVIVLVILVGCWVANV